MVRPVPIQHGTALCAWCSVADVCMCLHVCAGELQEPSKKVVQKVIESQDQLVENAKSGILNDETQLMGQMGRN